MKRALLTAIATACIFAAGIATGIWVQKTQPVPAPPIGVMGEIRDIPLSGTAAAAHPEAPTLKAEIERMKPDIEAFKQKLYPIKKEFRENLESLLSPEQCEKLKVLSERHASRSAPAPSGDQSPRKPKDGLESLVPIVIVPLTLEKLTDALQLSEEQRKEVHLLLLKRREQFLALVDANPPPSLQLGKMAPTGTPETNPEKR